MSIRLIAKDLYALHQEIEKLDKELAEVPIDKQPELKDRLRKAKAEHEYIRRALEGAKSSS